MKYSVLMSVYKNDEPTFLKSALNSIYENQTRKPDEIVVVFDGPLTEELYSVLEKFKTGKETIVKYLPQEVNKGLGEALRIGSEFCTGDYIFRMDSDDISDSERFKKQIDFIEKHLDIDVVGTDIAEFQISPDEENLRVRRCPSDHDAIVKMGKKRNPMNHVSVCIKKDALFKAGGYRHEVERIAAEKAEVKSHQRRDSQGSRKCGYFCLRAENRRKQLTFKRGNTMEQSTNSGNIKEHIIKAIEKSNEIELQKKFILSVMAYQFLSLYDEIYHTNKLEE